ncbi:class I SAM-dependent methyltransferase [Sphingomonas donggukensis]|uniref:Class I SAM-dependent methyltransferase n=1 Tax=Sphingomonas donggukensis TaxID=2949093 RepID=A0ABY4TQ66_9SPHN|nr:methyltransferase domain-containing protein [Sphingomonas donggukensis]URW74448.1 class I SAM-dependent methyltransferase [Sphingomonas donggukensis]
MTDTSALYDDYHAWKGWGTAFAWTAEEGRYYAAEFAVDPTGLEVLEIGFGAGEFLGWAKDQGARVSGIEITAASIAAAEKAGIPLLAADFEQHSALRAEFYDAVVAFDVFEHLPPAAIPAKIAAIARSLKPGGRLILRYPNGQSPFGLDPQNGDATHLIALSRAKIEQFASGTGLRTIRYGGVARVRSGNAARDAVRTARHIVRRMIEAVVRFAYGTSVELAPVAVHVLAKQAPSASAVVPEPGKE